MLSISIKQEAKSDVFSTIFHHIKTITENINIMIDEERVYIQAIDNARVSVFEICIPAAWFDEYTVPASAVIGISSIMLFKVLNARDKTQSIQIQYDSEEETDKLYINMCSIGENSSIFDKHFEVPLMDIESEIMAIPVTEYQAEMSLPSAHFASIVSQLRLFGDTLDIHCAEDKIMLSSTSSDNGKMRVDVGIDELTAFAIDEGETLDMSFSLTYIYFICLYNKLSKDIDIKITNEYPMKIGYQLVDGATITFYLAPKMTE
jgi:proliferating cell nuclear antigen